MTALLAAFILAMCPCHSSERAYPVECMGEDAHTDAMFNPFDHQCTLHDLRGTGAPLVCDITVKSSFTAIACHW